MAVERLDRRTHILAYNPISEGLINEEIANQLTVEPASVKRAVTRILATLGLRNRTQIAIGWFKAGM